MASPHLAALGERANVARALEPVGPSNASEFLGHRVFKTARQFRTNVVGGVFSFVCYVCARGYDLNVVIIRQSVVFCCCFFGDTVWLCPTAQLASGHNGEKWNVKGFSLCAL